MICSQLREMCPLGSQANHSGPCVSPQSVGDARVLQPREKESVWLIALLKLVQGAGVGSFLGLTTPLPVQVSTKVPQGP